VENKRHGAFASTSTPAFHTGGRRDGIINIRELKIGVLAPPPREAPRPEHLVPVLDDLPRRERPRAGAHALEFPLGRRPAAALPLRPGRVLPRGDGAAADLVLLEQQAQHHAGVGGPHDS